MSIFFTYGSHLDKGIKRANNEDYLAYFSCVNGEIFIICDGKGSHASGATASHLVVDAMRETLEKERFATTQQAIKTAFHNANELVFSKAQESLAMIDMASTCVLAIVQERKVYFGSVGDSRLYFFSKDNSTENSDKNLSQLTTDHAIAIPNHPQKKQLLRALGFEKNIEVQVYSEKLLQKNDVILLATKGLHTHVSDKEISEILHKNIPTQEKAVLLVNKSNENSGADNVSVQIIDFNKIDTVTKKTFKKIWAYIIPIAVVITIIAFSGNYFIKRNNQEKAQKQAKRDSIAQKERKEAVTDSLLAEDARDTTFLHTIQKGQHSGVIARKYNLSNQNLQELNDGEDLSLIKERAQMRVKAKMLYVLEKDQTLENLYNERFKRWKKYNINPKTIRNLNKNNEDSLQGILKKGRQILIPTFFIEKM